MAYTAAGLRKVASGVGAGPTLFTYHSTDAHTAVDEVDYFAGGKERGMKVNDIVIVADTDAPTVTLHLVTAVDSDGNATVGAATLA